MRKRKGERETCSYYFNYSLLSQDIVIHGLLWSLHCNYCSMALLRQGIWAMVWILHQIFREQFSAWQTHCHRWAAIFQVSWLVNWRRKRYANTIATNQQYGKIWICFDTRKITKETAICSLFNANFVSFL